MISAVVMFAASGVAFAAPESPQLAPDQVNRLCGGMRYVAHAVMLGHQNGVSVADAMKIADKYKLAIFRQYVIDAYKETSYTTKEYQDRAATDFANAKYIECYEAFTKKH